MRATVALTAGLMLSAPALLRAQDADATRLRWQIDSLLVGPEVDSATATLGERFLTQIDILLPELGGAERGVLAEAVANAFDAGAIRADLASGLAARARPELIASFLADRREGALAEMARTLDGYRPSQSLAEFSAALATKPPPPARLQRMAAIVEAEGAGDFDLLVDETAREAAHRVISALGGTVPPFQPLPDERFDAAYRSATLAKAVVALYRYDSVPDDLLDRVISDYRSEAGRWFVDSYAQSMQEAVTAGAARVITLATPEPEPTPTATADGAAGGLCRLDACGLVIDRADPNDAGAVMRTSNIESGVLGALVESGYQIVRGTVKGGLTIRLRPAMGGVPCFEPGSFGGPCSRTVSVSVEYLGAYPARPTPKPFTLFIIGCSLSARGVQLHDVIAQRIDLEFTPDETRKPLSC